MQLDLDDYLALQYATEVVPDDCTDGSITYVATHPELDGCMAHGDSPEEALENLAEARTLYITTLVERGLPVPLPRASTPTVMWRSYGACLRTRWTVAAAGPIVAFGTRPLTPLASPSFAV